MIRKPQILWLPYRRFTLHIKGYYGTDTLTLPYTGSTYITALSISILAEKVEFISKGETRLGKDCDASLGARVINNVFNIYIMCSF